MPKPKKPQGFAPAKTANPVNEMLWCFENKIRVVVEPEAYQEANGYWKQTGKYALVVDNAGTRKQSDFLYTKENITDAVNDLYREIYKRNYEEVRGIIINPSGR